MDVIDLRSDTVTTPTPAMRQAMAEAVVGDDGYGEDPTVARLEARAAQVLGTAAGLFCPSGTMANLLAVMTHTQPGDHVLVGRESHLNVYEQKGMTRVAGVHLELVDAVEACLFRTAIQDALSRPSDPAVRPRLVCIENPHNRAGGTVWDPGMTAEVSEVAHGAGVPVHVDGARLFNAAAALHRPVRDFVRRADSVMVSLSKGLAAPVGSLLLGPASFIQRARRYRKMLGGGMRQAGVMAAAGLVALDTMADRLTEDHEMARALYGGLASLKGLTVAPPVTNMVLVTVDPTVMTGRAAQHHLAEQGVLVSLPAPQRLRLVTHKDVRRDDYARVLAAFEQLVGSR